MSEKWLDIKTMSRGSIKIRKDKIVAMNLPSEEVEKHYREIIIYVQTHVGRTVFNFGLYYPRCWGFDHYLDEKTFYKLRDYLLKATEIKGELNLDSE